MKIGLCTGVANAAVIKPLGYAYIEENVQSFLQPEAGEEAFATKLKENTGELPVPAACCFLPGNLKCTGPDVDTKRLRLYAENAFVRAEKCGIRMIVFGSGAARQIPDGFERDQAMEQIVGFSQRIAPVAERHGVTIVLEPLNRKECNFINSVTEGATVVRAVGHPAFRMLADFYHMLMDDEPASAIVEAGEFIVHAHAAEKEGRLAPGTTGVDFGPFLAALKQIRYAGLLSFECRWRQYPADAGPCLAAFQAQVKRAGL